MPKDYVAVYTRYLLDKAWSYCYIPEQISLKKFRGGKNHGMVAASITLYSRHIVLATNGRLVWNVRFSDKEIL